MRAPKSARSYASDGPAFNIVITFIGTACLIGCAFAIARQDAVPSVLLFLFGGFFAYAGARYFVLNSCVGKPSIEISPEVVDAGSEFHLTCKRRVNRDLTVTSLSAFFVFRERVTSRAPYDDSATIRVEDRLIESSLQPGRFYRQGDAVEIEHDFHVPARQLRLLNPGEKSRNYELETFWVIKIKIQLDPGRVIWGEYAINVNPDSWATVSQTEDDETCVDVILGGVAPKKWSPVRKALADVLPHLQPMQLSDLCNTQGRVILERISQYDATDVKQTLEAAGAFIRILPHSRT